MSADPQPDPFSRSRHVKSLWLVLLGPPAVWLVQFQTNYALTAWVCTHGHRSLLTLVSTAALLLIAALAVLARREWRIAGAAAPGASTAADTATRSRFFAVLGLLSCGLFALATLAQAVAQFFIEPCWQ